MTTEKKEMQQNNNVYFIYCIMNKTYDNEVVEYLNKNVENILFVTKHELTNKIMFGVSRKSRLNLEINNEKLIVKPYKFLKVFVKMNITDTEILKDYIIKTYNSCYVGFNNDNSIVYFNIKDPKVFHNAITKTEKFDFEGKTYDINTIYKKNNKRKFNISYYYSIKVDSNMFDNKGFNDYLKDAEIIKIKKYGSSHFTNKATGNEDYIYWFITNDFKALDKLKKYNEENNLDITNIRHHKILNTKKFTNKRHFNSKKQ